MNVGVYHLIKDNEVIYIGQSSNIKKRLYGHKSKQYDSVEIFHCDTEEERRALEKEHIEKYRPDFNITLNPDKKIQPASTSTILLPSKLHQQLKIKAAKDGETIQGLATKLLWKSIGGIHL